MMRSRMFRSALATFGVAVCLSACGSKASPVVENEQVKEASLAAVAETTAAPEVMPGEGKVQLLTESQFEEKVARFRENPRKYIGEKPCIVDFYAVWCGPCKKLAPIMEALSVKYQDKVLFYKVDVDRAEELSAVYGIQSIPTLFFCANGEIRALVGFVPQPELEEIIGELLNTPQQ
ncbi:MAG: thioredoxin fold domain-containing protein [Bacteroidales bacterium]|nr:thioredoxin fold domain-containing protein [Candidatus Minthousia equi]